MGKSKEKKDRSLAYSQELRDDLLKHFEAGKGHISYAGKMEIRKKHGLVFNKTVCWANDRRRRHGVYDEKRFCKKLWKHITENPECLTPTEDLMEEFVTLFIKIYEIEGWGTSKGDNSKGEIVRDN